MGIKNENRGYDINLELTGDGGIDIVRDGAGCYTSMTITWQEAEALVILLKNLVNDCQKDELASSRCKFINRQDGKDRKTILDAGYLGQPIHE